MTFNIIKQMSCLIVFFHSLIDVWSQSPQNAIALPDGRVQFNSTNSAPSNIDWTKNAGGDGSFRIATGCILQPQLTDNYAVESGSNFCNLIVRNINMQLAGTYTCLNSFTIIASRAVLTVINQNANVSVLNSTVLAEGELVNISCSLAYSTSPSNLPQLIPTLSWTVPVGQNATAVINDTQINNVTSIITVLLQRPNLPIFQCNVNFNLIGDISEKYATNIPSSPVTSSNTSMIDGVLYPARTCIITSETIVISGICRLSNLSCVASANPPAKYSWVDVNDSQPWNSLNDEQFFPFAEDGRTYRCTAHSIIKGKEHSTSCTLTVPNQSQSPQPCKFAHENAMDIYSTDSKCNSEVSPISCSCNNGTYANLVCNATNVFPEPTYRWEDKDGRFLGSGSSYNAILKGTIKCIALIVILEVNTNSSKIVSFTDCCPEWVLIISFIIPWVGVSIIVTTVFTVCYFVLAKPFRAKMNSRFVWLHLMLPYGNNAPAISQVPSWKKNVFQFLFFVIAPTCGMVFFPVLVTLAYCSPKDLPCLIISMWVGVTALTFPLAFVLVYIIQCKQMTFKIIVGD